MDTTIGSPIVIVMALMGMFASYIYVLFSQSKFTYAADHRFVFKKISSIISIIALGYFITLFFPALSKLHTAAKLYEAIDRCMDSLSPFLKYLSAVWFIMAIALLPFGHSVVNVETNILDEQKTQQLDAFYSVFYASPYYFFQLSFSVILLLVAITVGESFRTNSEDTAESDGDSLSIAKTIRKSYNEIRPTLGFFFYHTKDRTADGAGGEDADQ
jgi:hypothetical protein